MTFHKKLELLSLASLSNLVLHLWVKPGACPRVEHLKGDSIGQAPALPANIRLSLKGLPGKNAPAYFEKM
jgi:hypothetical protein